MNGWLAGPAALGLVALGVWLLAAFETALAARAAGTRPGPAALLAPLAAGALHLRREFRPTEHPDLALWLAAPVLLLTLTLTALSVLPLAPGWAGAQLPIGLVFFTAQFALVIPAVFLAGWAPNSKYPQLAGYRFVGLFLAYEMPFAITLIATALPAGSLALPDIVAAQHTGVWNVLTQPLGFVVYLLCVLGIAFYGPLDVVSRADLAGGVEAELSGAPLGLWRFARRALLLASAAFGAVLFLGGGAGPLLPAWLWTLLKTGALAALLVWVRVRVPVLALERVMAWAWVALIPLSLVNLFVLGLLVLCFPGLRAVGA